jgi:hypothetical protein
MNWDAKSLAKVSYCTKARGGNGRHDDFTRLEEVLQVAFTTGYDNIILATSVIGSSTYTYSSIATKLLSDVMLVAFNDLKIIHTLLTPVIVVNPVFLILPWFVGRMA